MQYTYTSPISYFSIGVKILCKINDRSFELFKSFFPTCIDFLKLLLQINMCLQARNQELFRAGEASENKVTSINI